MTGSSSSTFTLKGRAFYRFYSEAAIWQQPVAKLDVPDMNSWQRDLLRVKGGIADYYVIGEIDVHALRRFQSSHRSPRDPFKPVPDGFDINYERKMLPSGESNE